MKLRKYLQEETVAQTGYRKPITVSPTTSVHDAVAKMQTERVGCVLVEDQGALVGIFTERDVLKRALELDCSTDTPVSELMTPKPLVAKESEPIHCVLGRMYSGGLRHLPVVNDAGQAIGTISVKRVSSFIADHFASAVYNLPPEPNQYGASREGA
jgi:CBS domain-containing protein